MTINGSLDLWQDAEFRKSSVSGANNCVELAWRKASFSGGQNGSCVEVARAEALFGVRDSKNVGGPVLMLGESSGRVFLAAVKQLS